MKSIDLCITGFRLYSYTVFFLLCGIWKRGIISVLDLAAGCCTIFQSQLLVDQLIACGMPVTGCMVLSLCGVMSPRSSHEAFSVDLLIAFGTRKSHCIYYMVCVIRSFYFFAWVAILSLGT